MQYQNKEGLMCQRQCPMSKLEFGQFLVNRLISKHYNTNPTLRKNKFYKLLENSLTYF